MLISTMENLPGYRIEKYCGIAKGSTVRSRHIGHDIMAKFKNIVGGEVMEYTKMMAECREQALDRMSANADSLGANAVVCFRFVTAEIMENASELLAYGTAVRVVQESGD
jgi:uncharacterized protein YbjQ (UPF0145 family)